MRARQARVGGKERHGEEEEDTFVGCDLRNSADNRLSDTCDEKQRRRRGASAYAHALDLTPSQLSGAHYAGAEGVTG